MKGLWKIGKSHTRSRIHVAKKAARLARVKDEKRKWRALSLVNTLTNQNVVLLHKGKS